MKKWAGECGAACRRDNRLFFPSERTGPSARAARLPVGPHSEPQEGRPHLTRAAFRARRSKGLAGGSRTRTREGGDLRPRLCSRARPDWWAATPAAALANGPHRVAHRE